MGMDEIVDLLSDLVAIDSVNPDLVPGAKGEGEIAAHAAAWLRRRGLDVRIESSGREGRPNVVAVAKGSGGGRTLMLNAHMDTVGVAGMERPFQAVVKNGKLYGRGAQDTKGALAAFMTAAAAAANAGLRGQVVFTGVVDEEYASAGTEAIAAAWRADAAVVGEPTSLEVVTEHKGFTWFEIETRGVAAHGSLPESGVDAIARMGRVLVEIEALASRLSTGRRHPTLGPGSIHASTIKGGQELSSYPASCLLSLERRTIPGESVDAIEEELRETLRRMEGGDPTFKAVLRRGLVRPALEVPRDAPIVEALARQVRRATGREAVFTGMGAWMDSALLWTAGIPSVVFGPSGSGLHGKEEWVDLESVRDCSRIVTGLIREFCG